MAGDPEVTVHFLGLCQIANALIEAEIGNVKSACGHLGVFGRACARHPEAESVVSLMFVAEVRCPGRRCPFAFAREFRT